MNRLFSNSLCNTCLIYPYVYYSDESIELFVSEDKYIEMITYCSREYYFLMLL